MEEDLPRERPDWALAKLAKEDLSDLSVADLEERIANIRAEIDRCTKAINARGDTKATAEKLFNLS